MRSRADDGHDAAPCATLARRTGFKPAQRVSAAHGLVVTAPDCAPLRIKPLGCGLVTPDVQSAKLEWEDAYRGLVEAAHDPAREEVLRQQLEAVTRELRRRLGGAFTLRELANEYVRADVWARDALAELEVPGWPRWLSLVEGAAFHLYSRGAVDYAP